MTSEKTENQRLIAALGEVKGMLWGSVQMDRDWSAAKVQQAIDRLTALEEEKNNCK